MVTQNSRMIRGGRLSGALNNVADAQSSTEPPANEKRLTEKDIVGLKYFDELLPLLKRLHHDGCGRDKAGNRDLHDDQYCLLVLLFLFNPICSSLRALQQASELKNVQKKLARIIHGVSNERASWRVEVVVGRQLWRCHGGSR